MNGFVSAEFYVECHLHTTFKKLESLQENSVQIDIKNVQIDRKWQHSLVVNEKKPNLQTTSDFPYLNSNVYKPHL